VVSILSHINPIHTVTSPGSTKNADGRILLQNRPQFFLPLPRALSDFEAICNTITVLKFVFLKYFPPITHLTQINFVVLQMKIAHGHYFVGQHVKASCTDLNYEMNWFKKCCTVASYCELYVYNVYYYSVDTILV
jgi:hypothetical protein